MKRVISVFIVLFFTLLILIPSFEKEENIIQEPIIIEPLEYFPCIEELNVKCEPQIIVEEKSIYEQIEEEYNNKMNELLETDNEKEWFISYKDMNLRHSEIIGCPETIYDVFENDELQLLFAVVQAEIGDEYSFSQKCNVASVIFNRVESEHFGNTLSKVLIKREFASISDGRYKKVKISETTILACEFAYEIKDTTNGCLFFDSNGMLNYEFVFNDGAHNFYKIKEK